MDLQSFLELTKNEAELLFSIEYMATELDASLSSEDNFKTEKEEWLQSWLRMIEKQDFNLALKDSKSSLIKELKNIDEMKVKIILFEAYLLKPYFNLAIKSTSGFGKGEQKEKTFTKDSYSRMENLIKDLAKKGINDSSFLDLAKKEYENALDTIPNDRIFSLKKKTFFTIAAAAAIAITGGLAAPAIGTIIGGIMGLSGAAATSAGLALLGGGAIASGGAGMLGGTVVIIGGGALIGGASGQFLSNVINENNSLVLTQLAKLITNIKVFTPRHLIEEVLNKCLVELKKQRKNLSEEIQKQTDDKKTVNKSKSLNYYNEAIRILQKYEEELLKL